MPRVKKCCSQKESRKTGSPQPAESTMPVTSRDTLSKELPPPPSPHHGVGKGKVVRANDRSTRKPVKRFRPG